MIYPRFKLNYTEKELKIFFTVSQAEMKILSKVKKDKNKLGFAIVFKTYQYLGYIPDLKNEIPNTIISWISSQLELPIQSFIEYKWKSRSSKYHLSIIRKNIKYNQYNKNEALKFINTFDEIMKVPIKKSEFYKQVIEKFNKYRMELPTEKKMLRLVNSTYQQYINQLIELLSARIKPELKIFLNTLLEKNKKSIFPFSWIKSNPGKLGIKSILNEIEKLNILNKYKTEIKNIFTGVPDEIIKYFNDCAKNEESYDMKRHPEKNRHTLTCCLLFYQYRKIIDNILNMFSKLIFRIENKTDKSIKTNLIKQIKKIYNKNSLLYNIAMHIRDTPAELLKEKLLDYIGEDILYNIIEEYEYEKNMESYEEQKIEKMKIKYVTHYRQMVGPILNTLTFKINNPAYKPILESIELIKKNINNKGKYYPSSECIPENLAIMKKWNSSILYKTENEVKISKYHFELYVLQKLEKALKCKEIWVEGAYFYRDPNEDLPQDWNEVKQVAHCDKFNIPSNADIFIKQIKEEMTESLTQANNYFGTKNSTYIYYPGRGKKGYFKIPKLKAVPERPILQEIKNSVLNRWGIIDLLDVLIEADRQINLSQFFYSTGQRQILSKGNITFRILLSIFGIGTNIGLKRATTIINPACSYKELLHFNNLYFTKESLRDASSALVNRIIEIRNPEIWGSTTACISDATHISSWKENIISEWNPHYPKKGVMAYWHVDKNSTCIFSQLKTISSSEIAAMIKGLILHDIEMRIGSNYVDSHGQSEVAFPFCKMLNVDLHPRLKGIKKEKLYIPNDQIQLSNLDGVIARSIKWQCIKEQYSEMVRYVTAATEKTGPIESILRRFHKNNRNHPTYKAFIEAGKALKTIHICRYLMHENYRREINDALNIIENWNSYRSFISYGNNSELKTNNPEKQELSILCLQFIQNAIIFMNTLLIERVIWSEGFNKRMVPKDKEALTALLSLNINPYGYINMDYNKPSILKIA